MLKTMLLLCTSLAVAVGLPAQTTFRKKFSSPADSFPSTPICVDQTPDGRFWMGCLTKAELIHVDGNGEVLESVRLQDQGDDHPHSCWDVEGMANNGVLGLFLCGKKSISQMNIQLVRYDQSGQSLWQKSLSVDGTTNTFDVYLAKDQLENGYVAAGIDGYGAHEQIQVHKVDPAGNLLWTKEYEMPEGIALTAVDCLADGNLLLCGGKWFFSENGFLVKLDPQGTVLWSNRFENISLRNFAELPNGDLIAIGSDSPNENLCILRMDGQGHVKWSKRVTASKFSAGNLFSTLFLGADGNILILDNWQSGGADIVCVSPDGALLWAKNYDPCYTFYFEDGISTLDGGIAGISNSHLIKTDGKGDLDLCPAFNQNLSLTDAAFSGVPLTVPVVNKPPVPQHSFPVTSEPVFSNEDCYSPPPLSSFTLSADTLCVGEPFLATANGDGRANAYQWNFSPGTPAQADSAQVEGVYFTIPGTHEITLEVRYGNCRDTVQQSVWVTPFPAPDLGADTVLCGSGASLMLDAFTPEGLNYAWSDGFDAPMHEINTSGDYAVTVSAGVCAASDSIAVSFAVVPSALSGDTLLCAGEPLLLSVAVPAQADIFWNDLPGTSELVFADSGWLRRVVDYGSNCRFADSIYVLRVDCSGDIPFYAPNIFHPGGNNPENAFFQVFCNGDVSVKALNIYDRWGSLVFASKDNPAPVWDGLARGQRAEPGVYTWQVLLRRLEEERWYTGSVTLFR